MDDCLFRFESFVVLLSDEPLREAVIGVFPFLELRGVTFPAAFRAGVFRMDFVFRQKDLGGGGVRDCFGGGGSGTTATGNRDEGGSDHKKHEEVVFDRESHVRANSETGAVDGFVRTMEVMDRMEATCITLVVWTVAGRGRCHPPGRASWPR